MGNLLWFYRYLNHQKLTMVEVQCTDTLSEALLSKALLSKALLSETPPLIASWEIVIPEVDIIHTDQVNKILTWCLKTFGLPYNYQRDGDLLNTSSFWAFHFKQVAQTAFVKNDEDPFLLNMQRTEREWIDVKITMSEDYLATFKATWPTFETED